ncbi:MAG: TIGR01777 family oxidoreductase [Planctomycetota bacterium]|jgi:uncharacterized protein (TIGR01777 family)
MKLFMTGATGLVGRRLVADRLARGNTVVALSRDAARARARIGAAADADLHCIEGDPTKAGDWQASIDGCDGVVHLAGAGIADRRWNDAYKRLLVSSRVESTREVVSALESARARPRMLVIASAIGYYGETGGEWVDETAPPGDDFLADLCVRWEAEAAAATPLGVRVLCLRLGVVLDERGGALRQMLTPFRLFAGGPIGSGRFVMSWVHWRDVVGLVDVALRADAAAGSMNVVAPHPVTNREFSRALGRAVGRPSWLPVPRVMLRLAMGEVARYITMSQRVRPGRALELGYDFQHPEIGAAMASLLGKEAPT